MDNDNRQPQYPTEIMPKDDYLDRIEEVNLTSISHGLIIQRRCPDDIQKERITPEVFGERFLAGMSVNLLGAAFKPYHARWTPKGVCNFPTNESFSGEYIYSQDFTAVYLEIARIHNKTFPARRSFSNINEFDKNKKALIGAFSCFSSKMEYPISYRISVVHIPTNANYWHCQVEIAPDFEESDKVTKEKATWQRNALIAMKNFLTPYASFEEPNVIPPVKREWYLHS